MSTTTVVLVHGFISDPTCWDPFLKELRADPDLPPAAYTFVPFRYKTAIAELRPDRRLPTMHDCASNLAGFLDAVCPTGPLILVGHSMGGLVIQRMIADTLGAGQGKELARMWAVVLFATPNRGSTILRNVRSIFEYFKSNPQDKDLEVLNEDASDTIDAIVDKVLRATTVARDSCPIPFQVFWGTEDNVVPEVSARGPFKEASGLPGDHSGILHPDPEDPTKYLRMRNAILHPVGHQFIYEIDLLEVTLAVSPHSPTKTVLLSKLNKPLQVEVKDEAVRFIRFNFSKQNRCITPFMQDYRSDDGFVELLSLTEPNQWTKTEESEYTAVGRRFTYRFTPDQSAAFSMKLKIYNGFGEGQRQWHNHFTPDAKYKLVRFTIDLKAYYDASYDIDPKPCLSYVAEDETDETLQEDPESASIITELPKVAPWVFSWEVAEVRDGVVRVVWDVRAPASKA